MLAETHLWNVDGVCQTHRGMCGKKPFIPDKAWEGGPTQEKRQRIPTVRNLIIRNRLLISANARLQQRNARQSEYIQFLQSYFKKNGVELPREVNK